MKYGSKVASKGHRIEFRNVSNKKKKKEEESRRRICEDGANDGLRIFSHRLSQATIKDRPSAP